MNIIILSNLGVILGGGFSNRKSTGGSVEMTVVSKMV